MDFLDFVKRGPAAPTAVNTIIERIIPDTEMVRAALRGSGRRWLTSREIAQRTGLSVARVNGVLCSFARRREIERAISTTDGLRGLGQRYRWTGGA